MGAAGRHVAYARLRQQEKARQGRAVVVAKRLGAPDEGRGAVCSDVQSTLLARWLGSAVRLAFAQGWLLPRTWSPARRHVAAR